MEKSRSLKIALKIPLETFQDDIWDVYQMIAPEEVLRTVKKFRILPRESTLKVSPSSDVVFVGYPVPINTICLP